MRNKQKLHWEKDTKRTAKFEVTTTANWDQQEHITPFL